MFFLGERREGEVKRMNKKIWLANVFLLAVIMVATILSATVQAAETDWWPMFHHDLNHTGTSTSTGPIRNSTLWTYTTGNSVYSSPAVVDGFVYVGSYDKKVYCLMPPLERSFGATQHTMSCILPLPLLTVESTWVPVM